VQTSNYNILHPVIEVNARMYKLVNYYRSHIIYIDTNKEDNKRKENTTIL
jgi:hypothetical protein